MSTDPRRKDFSVPASSRVNPLSLCLVPMTVALGLMATGGGGSPLVVALIAGPLGIVIGLVLLRLLLRRAARAGDSAPHRPGDGGRSGGSPQPPCQQVVPCGPSPR